MYQFIYCHKRRNVAYRVEASEAHDLAKAAAEGFGINVRISSSVSGMEVRDQDALIDALVSKGEKLVDNLAQSIQRPLDRLEEEKVRNLSEWAEHFLGQNLHRGNVVY